MEAGHSIIKSILAGPQSNYTSDHNLIPCLDKGPLYSIKMEACGWGSKRWLSAEGIQLSNHVSTLMALK